MEENPFPLFSIPRSSLGGRTACRKKQDTRKLDEKEDQQKPIKRMHSSVGFAELGISPFLVQRLRTMSITVPTHVQTATIPPILEGKNVVACARTGEGKTLSFALPIIQSLSNNPSGLFALVLTPTRELAFQIADQFAALGVDINIRVCVVVGGLDIVKQSSELSRKPHIIVATPGRLSDYINSNQESQYLNKLKYIVLDEADRLLGDTFADDLETIFEVIPNSEQRNMLLFSASMPSSFQKFQKENTYFFDSSSRVEKITKLKHGYIISPSIVRDAYLVHIIRSVFPDKMVIVFINKKRTCQILRKMLALLNIRATELHGKMSQSDRVSSLAKFRTGYVRILLATDIGSRGLDIPTVHAVINYEIPCNVVDYVHRAGRTARAGRSGHVVSIVTEMDVKLVLNIEKKIGLKMDSLDVVESEVNLILNEVVAARTEAIMKVSDQDSAKPLLLNLKIFYS